VAARTAASQTKLAACRITVFHHPVHSASHRLLCVPAVKAWLPAAQPAADYSSQSSCQSGAAAELTTLKRQPVSPASARSHAQLQIASGSGCERGWFVIGDVVWPSDSQRSAHAHTQTRLPSSLSSINSCVIRDTVEVGCMPRHCFSLPSALPALCCHHPPGCVPLRQGLAPSCQQLLTNPASSLKRAAQPQAAGTLTTPAPVRVRVQPVLGSQRAMQISVR
jgi:hypothetical protein